MKMIWRMKWFRRAIVTQETVLIKGQPSQMALNELAHPDEPQDFAMSFRRRVENSNRLICHHWAVRAIF